MNRRPVTWLLGVVAALVSVPTLVRLVGDHGRSGLVELDVFMPLAIGPLLVVGLVLVLSKHRRLALVPLLALTLDAFWVVPAYVPAAAHRGVPLTVLTANLRFGQADPAHLVELVRDHKVDVLATEELTPRAVDRLRAAGLEKLLPYSELAPFRDADGCGLWSRYPLDPLPSFALRFQSPGALVTLPTRQVVVRVVHPFPPTDGALYRSDNAALRQRVAALDPKVPTVLAGDFNASTDNSELRRLLGSRFRDASEQAGSGIHGTWSPNGWPFLLHLDHVLIDSHLDSRSTQVLDLPGSDHSALLARLLVE